MRRAFEHVGSAAANMAAAIYYYPGGFAGARLVRPAQIELENGHLIEVPLFLCDDFNDIKQAFESLKKLYDSTQKNPIGEITMPVTKKSLRQKGKKTVRKK